MSRNLKTVEADRPARENDAADEHAGAGHDDACRCKEASEMTPRELLRLMMSDLAFWKKAKKERP